MLKKILFLLILPFILVACDDDEVKDSIFQIVVSEAPTGAQVIIDETECAISTSGSDQTISITLRGEYDSFRITGNIPDWIYTTSSDNSIKFKISKFDGDESAIRTAEITFIVMKGSQSVGGRITIHQHSL